MKIFFIVERRGNGSEMPCLYYDEIPLSAKPSIVWAIRLEEGADTGVLLSERYALYQQLKSLDALPPSNLTSKDFWKW